MSDRNCKTCTAYDQFKFKPTTGDQTEGFCRANPPVTHVITKGDDYGNVSHDVETHFPWTSDDDWCSAHQPKESNS